MRSLRNGTAAKRDMVTTPPSFTSSRLHPTRAARDGPRTRSQALRNLRKIPQTSIGTSAPGRTFWQANIPHAVWLKSPGSLTVTTLAGSFRPWMSPRSSRPLPCHFPHSRIWRPHCTRPHHHIVRSHATPRLASAVPCLNATTFRSPRRSQRDNAKARHPIRESSPLVYGMAPSP
jgi:hypothetical protein